MSRQSLIMLIKRVEIRVAKKPRFVCGHELSARVHAHRLALCVVFVGLFLTQGCGGASSSSSSKFLRRSIGGEPSTLDPQLAGDTFSVEALRDLYEGLTSESPGGEIVPGVAEDWVVSPDGRSYTFRLRPDARWSNGDPVTADDFVAGLRRAVDPSTGAPEAGLLALIGNAAAIIAGRAPAATLAVTALGDRSLVIELAQPAPYFTAILATAIAYPLHRPAGAVRVSNGPYQLAEWTPGARLRLVRNPRYWDQRSVGIAEVDYLPVADSTAELTRYRANDIDITSSVPAQQVASLRESLPAELQIRPQLAVVYYAFNLARPPLRDAPGLRQALSLAIDRERLTRSVLKAGQVPAFAFVPPGIGGYTGPVYAWATEPVDLRLASARTLYAAAGYSSARPLRLRLLLPDDDTLRNVALAVSAMWREALGVQTKLTPLEYRAYLATRDDRSRWDVLSHGWNADYPDPGNFLGIFASAAAQNDAALADREFDRLLEAAAAEAAPQPRAALLARAERRLLDDYAVAPLYFPVSRRLVKPYVEGAMLAPMNHNYSKYLRLRPRR